MLLAGALPVLAFPAPDVWWLAWFGLAPGLLPIARSPGPREGGVRAWWLGTGYVVVATWWMAPEIGPGLLLLGAVLGALFVPFGVASQWLLRPPVTWRRAGAAVVVVPSCWLLSEWLRSWQALGGPWAVYGATQWRHPAELALAAVGGVWLLTFALIAANVALTIALSSLWSIRGVIPRRIEHAPGVRLPAVALAVAVACAAAGPVAFALTAPFPATRTVTIALVQPGVVGNANLRAHASETLTASVAVRADLIVWGESSIAEDLTQPASRALLSQIEALSAKEGAEILASQDATPPGQGHEKWAVLVSPAGIQGIYVKTRLVPFGEYIPFRQQLGWLTSISKAASSNMVPGTGAHLLRVSTRSGTLPIGVLVCFESAFPDMSRVDASLGAQVIVYQSATSTFQGTWGPDQHAALSALRAAETGRPVVQAALTGDSVAFDGRGRLLAWMGQSSRGVVTVRLSLPPASARTFYDSHGDYVPWAATVIVLLAALVYFLTGKPGVTGVRGAQYTDNRIQGANQEHDEAAGEGEPRR
jgi:apolipoprotein N-acyltransferase